MSEELTPLRALKEIGKLKESGECINTTVEYKLIETALKKLEQIETNQIIFENNPVTVGKKIMAFEIIKNKEVNVFIFLHSGDLETYNDMVEDNRKLTKEQFDLLKEVLL